MPQTKGLEKTTENMVTKKAATKKSAPRKPASKKRDVESESGKAKRTCTIILSLWTLIYTSRDVSPPTYRGEGKTEGAWAEKTLRRLPKRNGS
ncbi:hypothetical protein CI238_12983 [Colletotrichum incanum]|uniref:Uncharacterized protein n=1 Tax=Colletotrichum incanum TaxID=1573173 RepID=A0A162N1L8_COLIC|nr:hypothetical protein CI238_12983 [Colletotrichum incanum]